MKKLTISQIRLNTSTFTYYALIVSDSGHELWVTITEEDARWMHKTSGCKTNGVAGDKADSHNIYWMLLKAL